MTININDLTLGQLKELNSLLGHSSSNSQSDLYSDFIGDYVICRSRGEGVNAGYVVKADDTGVILKDARRLYYHAPKDTKMSWCEGVAKSGLSESSKVGTTSEKLIVEDYSLTLCTEEARQSIQSAPDHEQS